MSEAAGKPGWAFVSGMLTVNSGVHLAAAAAGQDTFTPLAGYSSGSKANAIWGGMNLVGGLALARWAIPSGQGWGAEGAPSTLELRCSPSGWPSASESWGSTRRLLPCPDEAGWQQFEPRAEVMR